MLWKGKGSAKECAHYRPICLEESALKLCASIMLARLTVEVGEIQRGPSDSDFVASMKGPLNKSHLPSNHKRFQERTLHERQLLRPKN